MLVIIVAVIIVALLSLAIIALVTNNARETTFRRLIWRVGLVILLLIAGLFWIRYQLTEAVNCLPNCPGVNFVGRDFTGRQDLANSNLVEAQMTRMKLVGANLQNTDISGASVQGSDLRNIDLRFAFLIGTDLTEVDFTGANLANATMLGADLTGSNLSGIDMTTTNIQGAVFNEATMVGVDLSNNRMSGLDFREADLSGAILRNAKLAGATLSGANLSGADLRGADLEGAFFNLANLTGADLTGANLSGASLVGAVLSSAILQDASLVGALIMGTDFDGADFRGANLSYIRTINQVTDRDLLIDPILADLNTLQFSALRKPSSLEGIVVNKETITDADNLLPPVVEEQNGNLQLGVRVGILHSVSGELAFNESAILDATLLAIQEINDSGGILGKQIETFVEDGASNKEVFRDKAEKLLEINEVDVIFGVWASVSRQAVLPVIEEQDGVLFYPAQYEGLESSSNTIYLGADPSQIVIPTVEYLLAQGNRTFYLVGVDGIYSSAIHNIIKAQLTEVEDATVSGEAILSFEELDYDSVIREVAFLRPDIVLSTLRGSTVGGFFDKLQVEQISASTLPVLSFNVSELEVNEFGPEKFAGHLSASSYYQTVDTVSNFSFVEAYKQSYGRGAVTSAPVESGYNAVYLWKALVEEAGSFEAADVLAVAESTEIIFEGPGGPVQLDPDTKHVYKTLRIGIIREDGLIEELFSSESPYRPDPFLTNHPWAESTIRRYLDTEE